MFALLFTAASMAQAPGDWILDRVNPVLEPDLSGARPWMESSVGAPSVTFDTIRNRFVMVFETRIVDPVDGAGIGCPQGVWGLGIAESTDGVTWTAGLTPLLEPTPGSGNFFSCVAAHPTILFEVPDGAPNGGIVVWFKAEQDEDVLATCGTVNEPVWGCEQYTGIGRLRVLFKANGNIKSKSVRGTPVIPASTFPSIGYPKVVKDADTYRMLLTLYPDIHVSTSLTTDAFDMPTPVMEVADYTGAIPWVRNEFFNPAFVCEDSLAFPLASFVGGRDTNLGTVLSGGWGKAISVTGSSWVLGVTAQQEWTDDNSFRHWDILRLVTDEYLVWFSESDPGTSPKVNRIYFGGTTTTFNNTDIQSKACP